MPSKPWLCRCSFRNQPAKRKCEYCGRAKPKKRVAAHMVALRDVSFAEYARLNELIHGQGENCGVCGKPPKDTRNLDRDHGHDKAEITYGKPRGLACPGDHGCNKVMARVSLERARLIVAYLERVENYYREQEAA